jgi:carbohydrate-selective porin OprB
MKKLTALFLAIAMLFCLVSCGKINTDKIRENLKDNGFVVGSAATDDMELLADKLPKDTIAGTKVIESITIFVYESASEAEAALETYQKGLGDLGGLMNSLLKSGVKGNTFYLATSENIVEIAYKGA